MLFILLSKRANLTKQYAKHTVIQTTKQHPACVAGKQDELLYKQNACNACDTGSESNIAGLPCNPLKIYEDINFGSVGFIGFRLVKRLLDEGNEIVGVDNSINNHSTKSL